VAAANANFESLWPVVRRLARCYHCYQSSEDDAQQVAAEALLRSLKDHPDAKPGYHITVVRHRLCDLYREERRIAEPLRSLDAPALDSEETTTFADTLVDSTDSNRTISAWDQRRVIDDAINSLAPGDALVAQAYLSSDSPTQRTLAGLLHRSKSDIDRAIQRLKLQLLAWFQSRHLTYADLALEAA